MSELEGINLSYPSYFLSLDSLPLSTTLEELGKVLLKVPRKPVGTVQIAELCEAIEYPNGLYLFFHPSGDLWYVGKASSRSFIGRVPAHFDQREDAWFNTIPKRLLEMKLAASYVEALQLGLTLEIVLLGVRQTGAIEKLEADLRSHLKPKLNSRNKPALPLKKLSEYGISH